MQSPAKIPVIVGVGEVIDRPAQISDALEPVALMAQALRNAAEDAGNTALLEDADSLDLIGLFSWSYKNPVGTLSEMLGIYPKRQVNVSMGGENPTKLIHEAALRILQGQGCTALIAGGEALSSLNKIMKTGEMPPWTAPASTEETFPFANAKICLSPIAEKLGSIDPAQLYPFYEVAFQAEQNITPEQGLIDNAQLWERYADVAADNEMAWIRNKPRAAEIATITEHNRMVSWPYPKLMMANPAVNQGAAVIVTSLEKARALGIAEDKLIYIWGGGHAIEADDFLHRDNYIHSSAQEAVLDKALALVGNDASRFDFMELYSCFPIVPKMARAYLGLENSAQSPTVAGGLTFFGGPINNYMSHACSAMVQKLRAQPGSIGLLYGQGGFVNKHHSLVLSNHAPEAEFTADFSLQDEANKRLAPIPERLEENYNGPAQIETYTVIFNRDGSPKQGVVVFLSPAGKRGMAKVSLENQAALERLLDAKQTAVGLQGNITLADDGLPEWHYQ
ncbi:acetyl-CoA acetyltransferase [Spongiibacter sp. KMU-158]|uniref:Acetyl-CoA acetyltransferase n=1 Tax=Spongiibacter pelagi TaxID=2760804 RepID=A0A927C404_9GAMM|nr:acetyl-CoA acetyltransferase [Spongiibacter pelagi]MBD2859597.1 acetyl-CoA acetyltransferase [Spongiibacter pelagi]